MRSFGFEISNNGFAHARKHAQELGPGAELPKTALPSKNERTRSKNKKKDPLEEVLEEVVEEEMSTSDLPPPNLGALYVSLLHIPHSTQHNTTTLSLSMLADFTSSFSFLLSVVCNRHTTTMYCKE